MLTHNLVQLVDRDGRTGFDAPKANGISLWEWPQTQSPEMGRHMLLNLVPPSVLANGRQAKVSERSD